MIKKLIGSLILTLPFAAQANAATLSITGPASATVGHSFELQIWGDFSGEGLVAGGIDFFWNAALVQLDNIQLNLAVDPLFSCPGSGVPPCPPATANSAPIVWGALTPDLIGPGDPAPTLMSTLSFTAVGAVSEAIAAFSMEAIDATVTGGWFGAGQILIEDPTFSGFAMNINVPLPAAFWFMIGGLGTLLGFRHRV